MKVTRAAKREPTPAPLCRCERAMASGDECFHCGRLLSRPNTEERHTGRVRECSPVTTIHRIPRQPWDPGRGLKPTHH